MKNRDRLILSVVMLFCLSLRSGDNRDEMLSVLRRFDPTTISRIRLDGVYCWANLKNITKYPQPVAFYNNGVMEQTLSGFMDSIYFAEYYSKYFQRRNIPFESFGSYEIIGDTINCYFYTRFAGRGGNLKTRLAHYNGIIKNRDTIIGWQMVPPYPRAAKAFNVDLNDYVKSRILVFTPFPPKVALDPNRIWLNQYRN